MSDAPTGAAPVPAARSAPLPLPEQSQIEIVADEPGRLVMHIPPGGKRARGLGCFATIWLGFMSLFTPLFLTGILKDDKAPLHFIIPFLLMFWAVGLGMAYFWAKMRFTRTFLLLEPDRIVLKRSLLGRESTRETRLHSDSTANLEVAYSENNVPVHRVVVDGIGGKASFATALSDEEKRWLARRINRFLGRTEDNPAVRADDFVEAAALAWSAGECISCGAPLPEEPDVPDEDSDAASGAASSNKRPPRLCPVCGTAQPAIKPGAEAREPIPDIDPVDFARADLPTLVFDALPPDNLRFHLPLIPFPKVRWIVGGMLGAFSLFWLAISSALLVSRLMPRPGQPDDPIGAVIGALFLIPGLGIITLALFVIRGRTTFLLDPDRLTVRWHLGPLGRARQFDVGAISAVILSRLAATSRTQSIGKSQVAVSEYLACTIQAGGRPATVLMFHDAQVIRHVAAVLQRQLRDQGAPLVDA